ncbi:hypothetical protein M0R72_17245 [Candidatus Pacearchaeota archaeon]|jgi:hypothetical protein|nr:hypothetical protein [Candidatus Pacearchaeota archaeon]
MDTKYILRSEGIIVVDRGAWVSGEDYEVGNLSQNSGSFICTADHTAASATEPGVGADWATVWKALQTVTGTYQSNYFKAQDTAPYYRLVDGSGADALIRLSAGILQFWDNIRGVIMAGFDMATGLLTATSLAVSGACAVTGALTVATEKTDHQIGVDIAGGVSTVATTGVVGGTWTISEGASDDTQIVTRTASTTAHNYRMPIRIPRRTASGKGAKIKSVKVSYTISGTADTTNDVLQFQILKQIVPADGSDASASVLAGDSNSDYDSAHNTTAERLAAGSHTLTVTIPTAEQAYAVDGEVFALRVYIKDAATSSLALALTGAVVNYAASEY